jgi:SAM-dependent methyltransferase
MPLEAIVEPDVGPVPNLHSGCLEFSRVSDAQGLLYDPVAESYERGRTGWPAALADDVPGETVLDLAAGTGKLTRVLVERYPRVVAVEPLAAMRAVGARVVPGAEWLEGLAEALPLADGSVDAAFVADAFHWFDAAAATRELARVIRPRGSLVIAFALFDGGFEPGLPEAAVEAVRTVSRRTGRTGAPKVESGEWRAGFDGAPFGELEERELRFEHLTDAEGVVAYFLSMSTIAARPRAERDELARDLRDLVPAGEHRVRVRVASFRATRR